MSVTCPNLATLVRSSRREANLTVSALAVRCGCSKSTISDIERGKTYNVGGLLLFELGAVLQLYGDDLLDAVYESSLNGAEPSEAEE